MINIRIIILILIVILECVWLFLLIKLSKTMPDSEMAVRSFIFVVVASLRALALSSKISTT